MRISDWSSDVCSSDLGRRCGDEPGGGLAVRAADQPGVDGRTPRRRRSRRAPPGAVERGADRAGFVGARRVAGMERVRLRLRLGSSIVAPDLFRSEEHTSELQSLMRISYAVFCLKKKHNILAYIEH